MPYWSQGQDFLQSDSHFCLCNRSSWHVHCMPGTVPGPEDAENQRQVFPAMPRRQDGLSEAEERAAEPQQGPPPTAAGNSAERASSVEADVVQQLRAPRQEEGTQRSPPALPAPLRSDTRHLHSHRLHGWSCLHGHTTPPEVGSVRTGGTRGIEQGSISGDAQPPPHPADFFGKDLEVTPHLAKAFASTLRRVPARSRETMRMVHSNRESLIEVIEGTAN